MSTGPRRRSPLAELTLFRFREIWREGLFWDVVIPAVVLLVLGFAFRGGADVLVAVADGPDGDALVERLSADKTLSVVRASHDGAIEKVQRGRVALAVIPGQPPQLWTDGANPQAALARDLVKYRLARAAPGAVDLLVEDRELKGRGGRYVDFLMPGILAFLMLNATSGVGQRVVTARGQKLLKRFAATPMRRSHFLLALVISQAAFGVAKVILFLAMGMLAFQVRPVGGPLPLVAFSALGALAFCGVGTLFSARTANIETFQAVNGAFMLPMIALSGVFFSTDNFPGWVQAVTAFLPLTGLADGLRAISRDGATLLSVWREAAVVLGWGVLGFVLGLRTFRWR